MQRRSAVSHQQRRAFTLIEIMVVVIVLGILAALVLPNLGGRTDDARIARAKSDITTLMTLVENFRLDMRRYPAEDEGLQVLRTAPAGEDAGLWKGPYARNEIAPDPWGTPYQYYSPAPNGTDDFGIVSLGADKQPGGEGVNADLTSWSEDAQPQTP